MDIQATKIELAQLLLNTDDVSVLNKIKSIFKNEKKDWFDDLNDFQKEQIEIGEKEIDNGEVVSWEEVKKQMSERKKVLVNA